MTTTFTRALSCDVFQDTPSAASLVSADTPLQDVSFSGYVSPYVSSSGEVYHFNADCGKTSKSWRSPHTTDTSVRNLHSRVCRRCLAGFKHHPDVVNAMYLSYAAAAVTALHYGARLLDDDMARSKSKSTFKGRWPSLLEARTYAHAARALASDISDVVLNATVALCDDIDRAISSVPDLYAGALPSFQRTSLIWFALTQTQYNGSLRLPVGTVTTHVTSENDYRTDLTRLYGTVLARVDSVPVREDDDCGSLTVPDSLDHLSTLVDDWQTSAARADLMYAAAIPDEIREPIADGEKVIDWLNRNWREQALTEGRHAFDRWNSIVAGAVATPAPVMRVTVHKFEKERQYLPGPARAAVDEAGVWLDSYDPITDTRTYTAPHLVSEVLFALLNGQRTVKVTCTPVSDELGEFVTAVTALAAQDDRNSPLIEWSARMRVVAASIGADIDDIIAAATPAQYRALANLSTQQTTAQSDPVENTLF